MNQVTKSHRFLFFYLLFLPFLVSAQTSDRITMQEKRISLRQAFERIEQQTDYTIAYKLSDIDEHKDLSLSFNTSGIEETMKQLLNGTGLSYKINGRHLLIFKTEENMLVQKPTQTIRGRILDAETGAPVSFATVGLANAPQFGTATDSLGYFRMEKVPVGRYEVSVSYVGYKPVLIPEILLSSSKEAYLEIPIQENLQTLSEVVVRPEVNKSAPLNPMAITGGRMLSIEEAARFANGFDDPARLVSAFAGVAGDPGSNAIAIRGNSPQFTQWRLEGVEIPNPTHFADVVGLGGGFLSGLSTHVIGNSDFYNGAFPAEYGNALAGVFDMQMRNGNNQQYEHTFQMGVLGIDLASEGPLSRRQGSSYLFNYRLSNTSLATGNDIAMKYQDLAFKLNFPARKAGIFSVWGLGLFDRNKSDREEDASQWENAGDRQEGENRLEKVVGGLTHHFRFNNRMYLRSSMAMTYSKDWNFIDQLAMSGSMMPVADVKNKKQDVVFSTYLNTRLSSRHTNRTGITVTGLKYDLDYRISPNRGLDEPMEIVSKGKGGSSMMSLYSSSKIDLNENLTASLGLSSQYFNLNDNWTLEPRLALKWNFRPQQSLSIAYGLHSRREKIDYYFVENETDGEKETNKYLDFSKSHHFGLAYEWSISPGLQLKVEPYYQFLFDIPVERGTSFSIINHDGFWLDRTLVNEGEGRNYGIDLTLEQYLNRGFYYMLTGSVFKSEYKGGDAVWRNTRLNRRFITNFVAGKEWMVGRNKQNVLNANLRVFVHGGDQFTPIDEAKTHAEKQIVKDETRAYSERFNPAVNGDVSLSYRINKKRISHEFALKFLNVGFYTGIYFYEYNELTDKIKRENGYGMIPNISYKIQF